MIKTGVCIAFATAFAVPSKSSSLARSKFVDKNLQNLEFKNLDEVVDHFECQKPVWDSQDSIKSTKPNNINKSYDSFSTSDLALFKSREFKAKIRKICSVTEDSDVQLLCKCATLKSVDDPEQRSDLVHNCEELFTSTLVLEINNKIIIIHGY